MKRSKVVFLFVIAIAIFFLYYLYGGNSTPAGQQPLVRLNESNVSTLKDAFNESASSVRALVLVSPT
jgi:hypothetical protein